MLNFNPEWRFQSPGALPLGAVREFSSLIDRVADPRSPYSTLELFKRYFAAAAGSAYTSSSSASWSRTDLEGYMTDAAQNAPLFIEAFYDACLDLQERQSGPPVPPLTIVNRLLATHECGFVIAPPDLLANRLISHVEPPFEAPSLDAQAQSLIQQSLGQSQLLLKEGRYRQAVQENLWLLETVATAFRGLPLAASTVQGKYFNKIAEELKRDGSNPMLAEVVRWMTTLHGYLSSPTGGGVRHGADIAASVRLEENDALLYCNLIRSYIGFLLGEHERLRAVAPS